MTRSQVLERVEAEVRGAVVALVDAAQVEIANRRASPHRWALFHRHMAETLPPIRWLARAHHESRARHFAALAYADDIIATCSGADLANALGLVRPMTRADTGEPCHASE